MTHRKTLLLIDTSALVYRAYHALPPLTTKAGEMVNAVYGVASTVLSVYKELAPDYIIAAFDTSAPTFRHKAFAQYKATRSAMPDDLRSQLPRVRELMDAFGIVCVEREGFEADDIIGTIACDVVAQHDDIDVVIVTGDNDALQLVTDRIRVRTFGRGLSDAKLYDVAAVMKKYGLPPARLADYKGLAGDSSDNIPGVRGVGAKTATKLLTQYGDIEGVYAHIDDITGALRTKLEQDRSQAFLSRDLGRIVCDVPLAYDLDAARATLNTQKLRAFLRAMNFFSLLKRLPDAQDEGGEVVRDTKYRTISLDDTADVVRALAAEECVAVCAAHDGATLVGFAFSARAGRAQFVPWEDATRDAIVAFFADTARRATLTTFDTKALIHLLAAHDIALAPPYSDVLLQAYVVGAGSTITLSHIAMDVLGEDLTEDGAQTQLALVPDTEALGAHAMRTADIVHKLALHYRAEIAAIAQTQRADASVATVLERMEIPLIPILAQMEMVGVGCDATVLAALSDELGTQLAALERDIHAHAGVAFNINSTQQLAQVLFDTLKLPTENIKKTKTGYSTAASELAKLHGAHPIIALLEEYRELYKLKSTYVDALPKMIADDGRIHSTFQQAVTATGRLSSTDPNLQNIPTRTEYAQRIRSAFRAREGFVLLSADYSQIDLRCVAHIAEDAKMIDAFRHGEDIHTATAMAVFGVSRSKVTKTMRRQAKALNFGLIYGMGAYGFAQSAGIDIEEARVFIEKYFDRFKGVARYMEETITRARERGYVETPFGRRRSVPEITSPNRQLARSGERMAINMPVQGMAADIMKMAMIAVDERVRAAHAPEDVQMILQVHDEIICEVRTQHAEAVAAIVKEAMESVTTLRVPLVVDIATGATWANLK